MTKLQVVASKKAGVYSMQLCINQQEQVLYLDFFQNRCHDLGLESHKIGIGILAWTNWNRVRKTSEACPAFCTLCLKEKPSELQIFICNYVPLLSKHLPFILKEGAYSNKY